MKLTVAIASLLTAAIVASGFGFAQNPPVAPAVPSQRLTPTVPVPAKNPQMIYQSIFYLDPHDVRRSEALCQRYHGAVGSQTIYDHGDTVYVCIIDERNVPK
jgi:hypothetical protein